MKKHSPQRDINAPTNLPEPPEWFNEGQVRIYHDLGIKVLALKIWADSDYEAFCILVDNLYGYQTAAKIIADEGVLIKSRANAWVRNPATIVRNACWTNIAPLLAAFGLTPSARAAMGVVIAPDVVDPVAEFLNPKPTIPFKPALQYHLNRH
mgnify:CR=1 FL=1